ncbi:hypothetical protein LCL97_16255 [Seohaeicola saemankumensis]|nr:hypothetical protein [Seohaeicola saemankumensis]MCA0872388.1 hypothetical protein [Seohaeicola saemankumensis]
MTQMGKYHGGLVFVGRQADALDQVSRIVVSTLEDYGHPVERQTQMTDDGARILCSQYMIDLTLGSLRGSGQCGREIRLDRVVGLNAQRRNRLDQNAHRLQIEITAASGPHDDVELSELMLVVMLYRLVDALAVTQIEWLSPDTILTVDQFIGAFTNVTPRQARDRQDFLPPIENTAFAPVDDTMDGLDRRCDDALDDPLLGEQILDDASEPRQPSLTAQEELSFAYRFDPHGNEAHSGPDAEDVQSDVRRLASWGMTGMMVFLSAPVAASMAAVNLARGEDFRLNTHVLSLTGFLAVMHSSGALENVVSMLPI